MKSFLETELTRPVLTIGPVLGNGTDGTDGTNKLLRGFTQGDDGLWRKVVRYRGRTVIMVRDHHGRHHHLEKIGMVHGRAHCLTVS
jgi:hypothetical protein